MLLPLPMIREAGRTGIPVRIPLSYGGGSLFLKYTLPASQPPVGSLAEAITASVQPNKLCTLVAITFSSAMMMCMMNHAGTGPRLTLVAVLLPWLTTHTSLALQLFLETCQRYFLLMFWKHSWTLKAKTPSLSVNSFPCLHTKRRSWSRYLCVRGCACRGPCVLSSQCESFQIFARAGRSCGILQHDATSAVIFDAVVPLPRFVR
jgi:hypothetical protein